MVTSGIRVGSPACTTRGFGTAEFEEVGQMIGAVLEAERIAPGEEPVLSEVKDQVRRLTERFPIYPG